MEIFFLILFFLCLIALLLYIIKYYKDKRENDELLDYRPCHLLTGNELYFYLQLKPIADDLGLVVLAKIRMADLVEPNYARNDRGYYYFFNRVKAKHIDFALCKPENLQVELLIELDDPSHQRKDRKKRDRFIEAVYEESGYTLLRLYSDDNIEKLVLDALGYEKIDPETAGATPETGS